MSLFGSIQMAKNALRAQQIGLQVVGQNISNANTPGYIREEVILSPAPTQRKGGLLFGLGVQVDAVVQKIDEGVSLTDILGSLANGAAVEARRAGVFIVEGSGVRSWRLAGFGELDRDGVIQPTESNGGIILDALRSAKVVRETEEADGRSAIAVPLVIADRVIAVLYADQGPAGQAGPQARPNWTASIELLGRHAGRALEAMTASRLAQAATGGYPGQRAQTAAS